jgi:hypothetical protein
LLALWLFATIEGVGSARGLVRTLKPKHQLDQIVLAQPLQIIAIHPDLESATRPTRKGWVITDWPWPTQTLKGKAAAGPATRRRADGSVDPKTEINPAS